MNKVRVLDSSDSRYLKGREWIERLGAYIDKLILVYKKPERSFELGVSYVCEDTLGKYIAYCIWNEMRILFEDIYGRKKK